MNRNFLRVQGRKLVFQVQHPYLTLGQIYSALAYYWDHREELDQDIERRLEFVDDMHQGMEMSSKGIQVKFYP